MIDNFEHLRGLMTFDEEHFYWCQVIKRRKENPGQHKNSVVVREYYFGSSENYDSKADEIRDLCLKLNARAYVNINRRNWEDCALTALEAQAKYIRNGDYKASRNAFSKACGKRRSEKRWIIDVDDRNQEVEPPTDVIAKVLTPNGYHLIVKPFDLRQFPTDEFDVHKDNPTVGYCP